MVLQLLYLFLLNLVATPLTEGNMSLAFSSILCDTVPEKSNIVYIPEEAMIVDNTAEDEVYKVVETMPRFPGCETKMSKKEIKMCSEQERMKYTYMNVKYPAVARKKGIEGTAIVRFIVEKDGSLTNIELLRDPGGGCGEESIRVVKSMVDKGIKWIPGKQRGVPVRVEFTLPIKFKLG